MRYAYLSNWIDYTSVSALSGKGYYVKNDVLDRNDCLITAEEMAFARRLNGRVNPYKVSRRSRAETRKLLRHLERLGVIRNDRGSPKCLGKGYYKTLLRFYNQGNCVLPRVMNTVLLMGFIPIFMLGVYMVINIMPSISEDISLYDKAMDTCPILTYFITNILFLLFAALVHERAHGNACCAYNGRLYEYGFRQCYLPQFYTLMKLDGLSKLELVQVMGAGVEANLFWSGIFMCVAVLVPYFRDFLIFGAIINVELVCINITCIRGSDGTQILSYLTGLDDSYLSIRNIKHMLFSKTKRKKRKKGLTDYMRIVAYIIMLLLQNTFVTFLLLEIILVIGVFV